MHRGGSKDGSRGGPRGGTRGGPRGGTRGRLHDEAGWPIPGNWELQLRNTRCMMGKGKTALHLQPFRDRPLKTGAAKVSSLLFCSRPIRFKGLASRMESWFRIGNRLIESHQTCIHFLHDMSPTAVHVFITLRVHVPGPSLHGDLSSVRSLTRTNVRFQAVPEETRVRRTVRTGSGSGSGPGRPVVH